VIVAVIAVHVVQMTGNQVVYVIAVGNCLVSATCAMFVALLMAVTNVVRSTSCRVGGGRLDHVFVDMAFVQEMQVPVVQVVDVAVVLHSDMSAVGTMLMRVLLVDCVCLRHDRYASFDLDGFGERRCLWNLYRAMLLVESTASFRDRSVRREWMAHSCPIRVSQLRPRLSGPEAFCVLDIFVYDLVARIFL
jgi:hypothetical protein